MSKNNTTGVKFSSERYKRHVKNANNSKNPRIVKTLVSKTVCSKEKSCSAGVLHTENKYTTKKTTQSDYHVYKKLEVDELCKFCGDCKTNKKSDLKMSENSCQFNLNKDRTKPRKYSNIKCDLQQYYRNENYQSCDSFNTNDFRKVSLKTIVEQPEKVSSSEPSIFKIYPNSEEEVTLMDPDKEDNIKNIKEFRENNYFECHSAKSRISSKGSVTSLSNHKCMYRYYLNERLFPVPLNTDHENNVRCIECHLPLQNNSNLSAMIQSKVKVNDKLQDMLLMLPVQNSLIIKERRNKEIKNDDCLYFGIIKLNLNGNSIFNRTDPEDSLALRYQKGYKEYSRRDKYEYGQIEDNDIVII